jgi:hypothetical protein
MTRPASVPNSEEDHGHSHDVMTSQQVQKENFREKEEIREKDRNNSYICGRTSAVSTLFLNVCPKS